MRILVFGTGAVGGYLGAKLAQADHRVTLVCRQETQELIQRHGLVLSRVVRGVRQSQETQPETVTTLRQAFLEQEPYDLLLVAMKSYDVETAINEMVAFCPDPPLLLTLQNGIGIEEQFIEQFGAARVMAGAVTVPLTLEARNSILEERPDRGLALAPAQAGQDISSWVALFAAAGIQTIAVRDYKAMKWSKAMLNMVGNATSAILNRHPALVYRHRPTFELEVRMLKEMLAVMQARRIKVIDLPGSPASKLAFAVRRLPPGLWQPVVARSVAEGRGNKLPSFQIDLNAGKTKNEILYHNGAVAKAGQEMGVPTPVNTALTSILLGLARGQIPREQFAGKPQALLAAVRRYESRAAA